MELNVNRISKQPIIDYQIQQRIIITVQDLINKLNARESNIISNEEKQNMINNIQEYKKIILEIFKKGFSEMSYDISQAMMNKDPQNTHKNIEIDILRNHIQIALMRLEEEHKNDREFMIFIEDRSMFLEEALENNYLKEDVVLKMIEGNDKEEQER